MINSTNLRSVISSRFKRTEIIKFPNQNASEDVDKLYGSKLSDEFTIQGEDERNFGLILTKTIFFLPEYGGLLVSVGGNYFKVWDVLAGAKLLTSMNHHHKTVTSLTLSRDGKFLISGSLDRQIVWTDLSLFRQVYTKHCSSSVMSVAVGGQDDYLGIGMLDGLIQIHKRKEERMEDGMIVNSRRYKKAKNHKYLQKAAE